MSPQHQAGRFYLLLIMMLLIPLQLGAVGHSTTPSMTADRAEILQNRFRIDHFTEQVTLLIAREYGSAPVIVITPDGSKWYSDRYPDNVKWEDGMPGDMITIVKPTPGPYQLIGTVAPGSKVQKVSKLQLQMAALPQPLYQGERLKVTAGFEDEGQLVRMPGLNFMVKWRAKLEPVITAEDEISVSAVLPVGKFADNGQMQDERPDDGIFTATLNFRHKLGPYTFTVTASNKIFTRELTLPLTLSASPIQISLIEPDNHEIGRWKLLIDVDGSKITPADTILDIEMFGPGSLGAPIQIKELTSGSNEYILPEMTEYGGYRLTGLIVSTTVSGREILLDMPEQFFQRVEPPPPPPDPRILAAEQARQEALREQARRKGIITNIIVANVTLFLLGIGGMFFWRWRQKAKQQAENNEDVDALLTEGPTADEPTDEGDTAALDEIDLNEPDDASAQEAKS
ncbi:TIGR03503 family protein [Shewanella sp. NFH-SH190041]|uniref:TIGR03503 family protein n=1 Tax=Shewanella sp. NFH-SH190041 TaxID=2950245 RepID=UPI0021C45BA1|nr:TIGR03503 family protein [Shewanella sp. NFH-SH190041]